jgi:hypothetical protein
MHGGVLDSAGSALVLDSCMELLSADKEKASELGKLLTTPNPI